GTIGIMALAPDALIETAEAPDVPVRPTQTPTLADRAFRLVSTGAALTSLAIVLVTLYALTERARPAFASSGFWHLLTSSVGGEAGRRYGIAGLLDNTAVIAVIALVVGVPLSISMAIFINEYAPARLRRPITSVIDLLAALPSLLYGIWAIFAFRQ